MSRTEPCACGAELYAPDRDDWARIAVMLWRHYQTDLHVGWRLGGVA